MAALIGFNLCWLLWQQISLGQVLSAYLVANFAFNQVLV